METTWDDISRGDLGSLDLSDSDSITRSYRKSKRNSKAKFLLAVIKGTFKTLINLTAIIGWVTFLVIMFDAIFLHARIIEWILIGS